MKYSITFLIFVLLTLSACKTVKTADGLVLRKKSSNFLKKKLEEQTLMPQWLQLKGKIKLNDNGKAIKGNAEIRIQKDEKIWMMVKKFGFEGARVLITPTEIVALDRLNKNYIKSDLSYIEEKYNLPADFKLLQDLLLGNTVFVTQDNLKADIKEDSYYLKAENQDRFSNEYWMDGNDFLLHKMFFEDARTQRQVEVQLSNYQEEQLNRPFPRSRTIQVQSPENGTVQIALDITKVNQNQSLSMPFEIPSHYQQKSL